MRIALYGIINPFITRISATDVHHEIELVLKITKVGKNIDTKFAHAVL